MRGEKIITAVEHFVCVCVFAVRSKFYWNCVECGHHREFDVAIKKNRKAWSSSIASIFQPWLLTICVSAQSPSSSSWFLVANDVMMQRSSRSVSLFFSHSNSRIRIRSLMKFRTKKKRICGDMCACVDVSTGKKEQKNVESCSFFFPCQSDERKKPDAWMLAFAIT